MNFDMSTFCTETENLLTFIGWALTIFKIAIPFVIITYGILDLGKAVTASKDDEIKAAAKKLLFRAIAGVAIFFVPTIILWLFGTIDEYNGAAGGFETCKEALLHPYKN